MQTFSIAKMCICVRYFPIIIHFTLSHVTAENNGACLASIPTISHVSHCPLTIEKWNERASKKRCQDIPQHCSEDFSYHCVINSFRNATIEVCAKPRQIAGSQETGGNSNRGQNAEALRNREHLLSSSTEEQINEKPSE
ncbi:uncharacterized protein LOC134258595 isoform X2 [Saccostrea cucullata]|uniref:uncharacterized protein LOC134258595 isoform X2 n=1 Tax=Saccostrea cuccullata TaxID=36930 RepID=UPI002ED34486